MGHILIISGRERIITFRICGWTICVHCISVHVKTDLIACPQIWYCLMSRVVCYIHWGMRCVQDAPLSELTTNGRTCSHQGYTRWGQRHSGQRSSHQRAAAWLRKIASTNLYQSTINQRHLFAAFFTSTASFCTPIPSFWRLCPMMEGWVLVPHDPTKWGQ